MKISNELKILIKEHPWSTSILKIKGKLVTAPNFALALVKLNNMEEVAKYYGYAGRTSVLYQINTYLPELKSSVGTHAATRVLNLFDYQHCFRCEEVKPKKGFTIRRGAADYECKKCMQSERQEPSNKKQANAREAKRRATKLKRTPIWADIPNIKAIYEKCPEGCHVDHIIPLKGKLVSGLHVETNLQYLTAVENLKKSNKYLTI